MDVVGVVEEHCGVAEVVVEDTWQVVELEGRNVKDCLLGVGRMELIVVLKGVVRTGKIKQLLRAGFPLSFLVANLLGGQLELTRVLAYNLLVKCL